MNRLCLALGACLLSATAFALADWRTGERQPLWPSLETMPDRQTHQFGTMNDEKRSDETRMPYLEWFAKPANPNGACLILISGGSYNSCCDVGLLGRWKATFEGLGYQTVNLVYRTPRPTGIAYYQTAWEDGQRAVRLVRAQAVARGFDPERIGVVGMSAGGHLVTLLATSSQTAAYPRLDETDDLPCHVNIAIANAPAYNTRAAGERGVACPEDGTLNADPAVSPVFAFDAKTCPTSFHHGESDIYTPNGSTRCYREYRKRKVPAELHLYADKPHGAFGLERAIEFLRQMNFDGQRGEETDRRVFTGAWTSCQETNLLWMVAEKMPEVQTNQTTAPYLTWYVPKELKTKAIQIVFPGGGYSHCNATGEGLPAAEYFNRKGMTAVVVTYRCPRPLTGPKYRSAWIDAQRAVRLVRSQAAARGLDPERIGAMGFSAGGHLTLLTATSSTYRPVIKPTDEIDRLSASVQWACPIYPAYSLTDGAERPNAQGGNEDDSVLVPEFLFDIRTPPMCLMHGDADSWAAMNSVKVWERLRRMGVSADLHTLATRGHCFQFKAADGTGSATWLNQVWDFLVRKGFVK